MTPRLGALSCVACLVLWGCPGTPSGEDGGQGEDSGIQTGTCTEQCIASEVCDPATHSCVSRCGVCDAGVCTAGANGTFSCQVPVTTCNGVTCSLGQNSCIAGKCSCSPGVRGTRDSCAIAGRVCHSLYNAATQSGGACDVPGLYDECSPNGPACTGNTSCSDIGGAFLCLKTCTSDALCNSDEFCFTQAGLGGDNRCYPPGLFGFECAGVNPDGGTGKVDVAVANPCARWDTFPNTTEPTNASTCSYALVGFAAGRSATPVCRPPGAVGLYGACQADYARSATATQCAAGLECVLTRGSQGLCMQVCNAAAPAGGFTPQPACGPGQACVNMYRQESVNSVLGVCMQTCSVFANGTSHGCNAYATTPSSCMAVPANGLGNATADGSGLCVPQKATVAAAGQTCVETDAFRGAACVSGNTCLLSNPATEAAKCSAPCDLGCLAKTDGGSSPARCETEANARCVSGACTRVTSTSGTTLGFCL